MVANRLIELGYYVEFGDLQSGDVIITSSSKKVVVNGLTVDNFFLWWFFRKGGNEVKVFASDTKGRGFCICKFLKGKVIVYKEVEDVIDYFK